MNEAEPELKKMVFKAIDDKPGIGLGLSGSDSAVGAALFFYPGY